MVHEQIRYNRVFKNTTIVLFMNLGLMLSIRNRGVRGEGAEGTGERAHADRGLRRPRVPLPGTAAPVVYKPSLYTGL